MHLIKKDVISDSVQNPPQSKSNSILPTTTALPAFPIYLFVYLKMLKSDASKMVLYVTIKTAKLDDLIFILNIHIVEGEDWLPQGVSWSPRAFDVVPLCVHYKQSSFDPLNE